MKKVIEMLLGGRMVAFAKNINGRKSVGVSDYAGLKGFQKDSSNSSASQN